MRWPMAVRLARRELRGGLRGFRIFLACLILGVAAIATVQSVSSGIIEGLREDGQAILGGDVDVRRIYRPAEGDELVHFRSTGDISITAEMRAMARIDDGRSTLVELKSVDTAYPLYGSVELSTGDSLAATLAQRDGVWGGAVEPGLLDRLGIALGDRVLVGDIAVEIRAELVREPDRASDGFTLGPRLMVVPAALAATGLVREGSQISYHTRIRLPPGTDVAAYAEDLRDRFPDAGWRIREFSDAAPSLERMVRRLTVFLTLVGLTALLVGGVGVGNAVKAYLDGRLPTIATLKGLGASGRLIFQTYFAQILILAVIGIAVGLAIGATAPLVINGIVSDLLPVDARIGLYPMALVVAAGFGILTAIT
ncbi:MAG: ABC transporter permease, partial [Inquilinus sp.]|nr:ABC transporter permease [Inquilinus sp.]